MNKPDLVLFKEYCNASDAMVEAVANCWEQVCTQSIIMDAMENAARHLITHLEAGFAGRVMQYVRDYMKETGQDDRVIYALFQALILPESLDAMRAQGIPEDCIRDNLRDFYNWERNYTMYNGGAIGYDNLAWMLPHFTGSLVKLGRLQFVPSCWSFPYMVYRSRTDGSLLTLAREGLKVTADGSREGAGGFADPAVFTTTWEQTGDAVTAYPVDMVKGIICAKPVTIDLSAYELFLMPGSPVIDIHIPEEENFSPELVAKSLDMAREFYAARGSKAKVFACDSWLLDYQLSTVTAPGSNIRSFMERFSKLPMDFDHLQILERVMAFDLKLEDLPAFECRTGLQRRVKERLLSGGKFAITGGFILI
ncbi:MAG: DUF5596 domain-containing protein [Clostridia bacterium]|nr:DUF5596 domain-containing protein [Clostridia bacterium]